MVDFALLNLLFLTVVLLNPEILNCHRVRTIFLSLNVAYIPVAWLMKSVAVDARSIHLDRVVSAAMKGVCIHIICFTSLLYLQNLTFLGLSVFFTFYLLCLFFFPLTWIICRLLIKHLRRKGYDYVRCVIVGTNSTARTLTENMINDPGYGYRILGYFDNVCLPEFDGNYIGPIDRLEEFVKENAVDEIYFTLSGDKPEVIISVMKTADDNMAKFFYVPRISRYITGTFKLGSIGTSALLSTHPTPLSSFLNRAAKRTFDILFSIMFLAVSPVIFIPVAIAIKLSSPGPVFFKQQRTGYHGKPFMCYKFRTMKVNDSSDSVQATANDPRKTRVGEFLRHTSIDELPQFLNVLRGEMSVVGPRPHMLKHTEDYSKLIDRYMVRHMVKPGITGWAQVTGFRGETKYLWQMQGRVERDMWYIEHWSFLLDLKIIVKTVTNAVRGEKNAF